MPEPDPEVTAMIEREIFLTPEVAALIRLPIPVSTLSKIARAFPKHHCQQRGEWFCILTPPPPTPNKK